MAWSCAAHAAGALAGGSSLRNHPGWLLFVMQGSAGARWTSCPQPASHAEGAFGEPRSNMAHLLVDRKQGGNVRWTNYDDESMWEALNTGNTAFMLIGYTTP